MTVKVGDQAPDFELFGERDPETGAYRVYRLSRPSSASRRSTSSPVV